VRERQTSLSPQEEVEGLWAQNQSRAFRPGRGQIDILGLFSMGRKENHRREPELSTHFETEPINIEKKEEKTKKRGKKGCSV